MMSNIFPERPPSQVIRETLADSDHTLTVQDLIAVLGSQSFGLMFVGMALPLTIPLPPGLGFIPAALLGVWAFQRALGGNRLWLPSFLGKREISPALIRNIKSKGLPLCERLERLCSTGNHLNQLREPEIRLASLSVVFMSLLIMLPTPFLNTIPAVITILMGLAILNSNRRLLWVNMSLSLLAMGFIGSTLYIGSELLLEEISEFIEANPGLLEQL